jgi:hypothetical protein
LYELTPKIAYPGDSINVRTTLFGDVQLAKANLGNSRIELIQGEIVIGSFPLKASDAGSGKQLLSGAFAAPQQQGPYHVKIVIPGMETVGEAFAVMTR